MSWSSGDTVVLRQVWSGRRSSPCPASSFRTSPACSYVHLEQPYRRSAIGIDTLDHELDLWSDDGVTWDLKDADGVKECVADGRFDEQEAQRIWADAAAFQAEYERNGPWSDLTWAEWTPPIGLSAPALPGDWAQVPAA